MGAAGVGIATNVGDFQLHAPELRNFWREMSRRKLMVLVHPTCPCDAPQNDPGTFLLDIRVKRRWRQRSSLSPGLSKSVPT